LFLAGFTTPINDNNVNRPPRALAFVQFPRHGEMVHHVVFSVQGLIKFALCRAPVCLRPFLGICHKFIYAAKDQHSPAIVGHGVQGLKCNSVVNLRGLVATGQLPRFVGPGLFQCSKRWVDDN
jgi:hypothetical protein